MKKPKCNPEQVANLVNKQRPCGNGNEGWWTTSGYVGFTAGKGRRLLPSGGAGISSWELGGRSTRRRLGQSPLHLWKMEARAAP